MALFAYRCRNCGLFTFPLPCLCRSCGGREFEAVPLSSRCRLITWTRLFALPSGYKKPWRSFGIAEFENGLRVTGVLDCKNPMVGMELHAVRGIVRTHPDARSETGFIFQAENGPGLLP
ncbi:MAG: hypothetical protein LKK00_05610 [Intestinimonas sp.]|jgi:uncharacterized OB-fold protein|nr:hypothetical protein [Intestinimonas sp.]